jgi:hypothetical protein
MKKGLQNLLIGLLVLSGANGFAQEILDQSQTNATGGGGAPSWVSHTCQTFVAGANGVLTRVEWWGNNNGAVDPNINFDIVKGTDPNGPVIGSGVVNFTNTLEWQNVPLTMTENVIAGTTYWILISNYDPNGGTGFQWNTDDNSYPNGTGIGLYNSPYLQNPWNYDYVFKTFVIPSCDVDSTLNVVVQDDTICAGDSTTIDVLLAEEGVRYTLTNTSGIPVGDSIYGNDNTISFNTGSLSTSMDYNIFAERQESYAIEFDGIDDYVEIPNDTRFNWSNEDFSINFWVYLEDTSANQAILSYGDPTVSGERGYDVNFEQATQTLIFTTYFSTGGGNESVSLPVSINEWTHVTFTHQNLVAINAYKNGTLSQSVPMTSTTAPPIGGQSILLGQTGRTPVLHGPFKGMLDELSWWDKELSPVEIATATTTYFSGAETDIIAYYTANSDKPGASLTDGVAAWNGTLMNMDNVTSWANSTVLPRDLCSVVLDTTIHIEVNPTPLITIDGKNHIDCFGNDNGVAFISVSGGTPGYTYDWEYDGLGDNDDLQDQDSLSAGFNTIIVTDTNGCVAVDSVIITQPSAVYLNVLSATDVLCNGGNDGTVTSLGGGATPPYSYLWSSGDPTASASNLTAGNYIITVTDANGCIHQDSIMVNEPSFLDVSAFTTIDVLCNGDSNGTATSNVSGGTPGYTYLWSTTGTGASITNLAAGNYDLTVTDANGCTGQGSVPIFEPTVLTTAMTSTDVLCNGDADGTGIATPSGGTPVYTYSWSTAATDSTAAGLNPGVHYVTITDNNGCSVLDSVTIAEPQVVTASISATDISCNGFNDGFVVTQAAGGLPGYTYLWSNNDTTSSITGLGVGNYSVVVTDANGCTTFDAVTISEPPAIVLSTTTTPETFGNDGAIDLTVSGGVPGYEFDWDNDSWGDNDDAEDLTGLTGNATYGVIVTDTTGCMDTLFVNVGSVVGISLNATHEKVNVYPNPTTGWLSIDAKHLEEQTALNLLDASGRLIFKETILPYTLHQLDLSEFESGMYFIQVNQQLIKVIKE